MRLLSTAPPGARLTLVLCFIVALLEGMDLQAMGIAAPAMAKAFGFQPGQMGLVFSASILGLLPGAFIGGWCADRIGRKRVLIACVLIFGVFSVATAHVWNLESLLLARLLTGIGLGGALPNLIALSAESVDERARATAVSLMYCGVPLGGALAAVVGLLDVGRWQTVFYVGGLAPLLVAPLLGRYLAETAGFLRSRDGTQAGGPRGAWLGAIPLSTTLLLWLGYFFTLTVMYMLLNWLPSLLVGQGFSRGQAVGVQILFNLGGGIGSVLFGLLMDRWRPRLTVLAIYLGILLGLAGLGLAKAYPLVALAGFAAGLFVVGGQLVLYALAPQLYPAAVRATGTGAAVAVGRLGAMAGPLLAGQVLALGGGAATLVVATPRRCWWLRARCWPCCTGERRRRRLQPVRRRRGMRSLLLVTLLTLTGLARAATTDGDPATATPPPLQLEPLARFEVALDAPVWELGQTSDLGKRRIIPITGGRFDGQRLHGRILDNGADWQVVTADGLAIIDTRYLLQTDDGALIYLQTKGYRYGPPEVMRELAAGKPVDPRRYFFRVTLTFETAAPAYAWLNRALGVGSAMRLGKAVVYDAYLLQ